jgi:hypothetical protein
MGRRLREGASDVRCGRDPVVCARSDRIRVAPPFAEMQQRAGAVRLSSGRGARCALLTVGSWVQVRDETRPPRRPVLISPPARPETGARWQLGAIQAGRPVSVGGRRLVAFPACPRSRTHLPTTATMWCRQTLVSDTARAVENRVSREWHRRQREAVDLVRLRADRVDASVDRRDARHWQRGDPDPALASTAGRR